MRPTHSIFSPLLSLPADPDAPPPFVTHRGRAFRHWAVGDIPTASLRDGETGIEGGRVLSSYFPPRPPPGSGVHRYQLRLFEQTRGSLFSLGGAEEEWEEGGEGGCMNATCGFGIDHDSRRDFDVDAFVDAHGLVLRAHTLFTSSADTSNNATPVASV